MHESKVIPAKDRVAGLEILQAILQDDSFAELPSESVAQIS
jgi:hypothetical protein